MSEVGDGHFDVEETRPPFRQSVGNPVSPVSDRDHPRTGEEFSDAQNMSLTWTCAVVERVAARVTGTWLTVCRKG